MKLHRQPGGRWLAMIGVGAGLGLTGCQVDIGGQTLPSPYWVTDDVQYFPPGHEFKLQKEADAMSAAERERALIEGEGGPMPPGGQPPQPIDQGQGP
jgi:hypothetical protein